jgi:hypothetical protein
MKMFRTKLQYLVLLSVVVQAVCAEDCGVNLQDTQKGVHAVMENCKNVGTFSLGGFYNGEWEKLTYYYPQPWAGTFITIKVGDRLYTDSIDPKNGIRMDQYLKESPAVQGNKILVRWKLPEEISVEESLETIENSTLIHLKIKNENPAQTFDVGARLHLDTMLGDNDGAPIYVPGDGLKVTEKEYTGKALTFKYWKAYNRQDAPNIVSTGILYGKLTYPDKMVIANWKQSKQTLWDYPVNEEKSVLGDSAVLLYFNPTPLASGETKEIITGYGSGDPVMTKLSEITEIILNNITGQYCMGEDVVIKVDTGSRIDFEGSLVLEVKDTKGEMVYSKTLPALTMKAESLKSSEFTYTIPDNVTFEEYTIDAKLYNSQSVSIDEKQTKFTVDAKRCGITSTEPPQGPNWLLIGLMLVIILVIIIFIASRRKGEVVVTKIKEGPRVIISVYNNSDHDIMKGVIEDRIMDGSEVDIHTLNVRRRGTKLTLDIGTLKPGQKVSMEYRIKNVNVVPKALFRWDEGEKLSQ